MEWNIKVSENLIQYVDAASRGDTDAMAKLYSKTLKASYFLAAKLSESESEAVEITKKAYARAFCSIDKLKKPEAFEIWLKQIISTIYKDNAKFIFNDADGNAQDVNSDFLPEAILEDDKAAAKVMEAVAKLSPERKTAVLLHYYMGMPVSALAKYFGVSESTATAILSNAKADINSKSGIKAPDYPELATLPVLTRLFKNLVAKMGIDNNAVREIFVFAIESYLEVTPKTLEEPIVDEAENKEEPAFDPETAEESAETEEKAEESDEPAEAETEETAEEEAVEEETENVPEELKEATDETTEETIDESESQNDGKAEIEDSILSFKNRISSMLGVESTEKAEVVTADDAEPESDTDSVDEIEADEEIADEQAETAETEPEIPNLEEDTFEKIKQSIDGLAEITDGELPTENQDDGAVAFADFGGSEQFVKEEPEANEPEENKAKPAVKKAKKPLNVNPKIIIAAVVILVVIVVAVVLIVKGGKKDDVAETTTPVTAGYSDETYEWVALPALAEYEEIEYLNENFNSFKDPDTGNYGLIDYQGNVVLEAKYNGFRRCSNGKYYGNGVLADSNYHIVAEADDGEYEVVMIGSTASVGNQKHTDHATSNSTTVDGTDYDERDRYYEGYAAVRKDGKWGYVSSGGKIVVPYEFEAVNDIPSDDPAAAFDYCRGSVNGYVAVKKDGKMGIIKIEKESYEIVVDYKYDMICQGKGGVFLANNGTEWGNIVIGSVSDVGGADDSDVTTTLTPVTTPAEVSIGKYTINSDETNIRSTPDTDGDDNILAALDEGYEINALEKKKGSNGSDWIRFDYNGQTAWVSIKKLDKAD